MSMEDHSGRNVNWQIVVVCFATDANGLGKTLLALKERSLKQYVVVLASDTPALRAQVEALGVTVDFCLPDVVPSHGYWSTLFPLLPCSSDQDLLVVRAGVDLPERWDARLMAVTSAGGGTLAAVSPLSSRNRLFSIFSDPSHCSTLSVKEIDQWLNHYSHDGIFDLPCINQSVARLSGGWWHTLTTEASDSAIYQALYATDYAVLGMDALFVDDSDLAVHDYPDVYPQAVYDRLAQYHPLATIRHALTELSGRAEAPAKIIKCLPIQLHIAHSWGGGLGRWVEDYIAGDTHHHNWVLRPIGDWSAFGQTIALYETAEMSVPLKTWTLARPIVSIAQSHEEYRAILSELIEEYHVESLVISSLIGHSLDLLKTGLPTLYLFHDYFPFCPALYATYTTPCSHCDDRKMRECRRNNPLHEFFLHDNDEHWEAIRRRFLEWVVQPNIQMVAPSQSVVDRLTQLSDQFSGGAIAVIEHGLKPEMIKGLAPLTDWPSVHGQKLKIAMLGSVSVQKGEHLLAEIIAPLTKFADLILLGTGEGGKRFKGQSGVTVVEHYAWHELGALLREYQVDIGLLLSTVPETFSYTLSELWAAKLPVVATRIGAFESRIQQGKNGWLVELTPDAILSQLQTLNGARELIAKAKAQLMSVEETTIENMADTYFAKAPVLPECSIKRYRLPRKIGTSAAQQEQARALYINHQVSYRQVLVEFLEYSRAKLTGTPRIPRWLRGIIGRSVSLALRLIRR